MAGITYYYNRVEGRISLSKVGMEAYFDSKRKEVVEDFSERCISHETMNKRLEAFDKVSSKTRLCTPLQAYLLEFNGEYKRV